MRYSPFRHLGSIFHKRPIHFTLFLTRRCNARCSFCFYHAHEEIVDNNAELTLAEIEKVAGSMGSLLWLAFSGGEIFLRRDLVDITRIFYKKNSPALILFPTNGLLTERIAENVEAVLRDCPKSTIIVKLSLDGPEQLHDSIRGVHGCYKKTMATCGALAPLLDRYPHFELGINTVFCRENQDHILELIDFVGQLEQVKTHTVSLIRGDAANLGPARVDLRKYHAAITCLENNLKKRSAPIYRFGGARLKAAQDILQRRLINKTVIEEKAQLPCYAGRLNLVLTENGDLFPCESFSMRLGNVRQDGYDIRELLRSDRARQAIASINRQGCFCTHECYMMTNILFNPHQYPALFKEYLQLRHHA